MSDEPNSNAPAQVESQEQSAIIALKNSTAFLVGDMAIKFLGLIFNIYVVRQLGDEKLGLYSAALAYVALFSILGDLGMTQYATREIARRRQNTDGIFWDLVVVRTFLGIGATIVITGSAMYIANYDASMVFGIFLACLGFFAHAFLGPVLIIFVGSERLEVNSLLTTLVQVFFVSVGTSVLVFGYSYHMLIIATYIGAPVAAVVGMLMIRRLHLGTLRFKLNMGSWYNLFLNSLPFAVITFTLSASKDLDTVLLSLWRTPQEVGWYRAAYDLTFKLLFIRAAILRPLSPQMARYYGSAPERVGQMFNFSFKLLWAITLPIAIGCTILAVPMIDILYAGQYPNSAIILAIIIWSFPLLSLSSLCGTVSTATDKEKKAMGVYTFAALLNLGTNIVAIPIWGYIGAAASTVLTEAVTLIFFYRLVHPEFPLKNINNVLVKPTIAGVVMGGVVFLMKDMSLLIPIGIGMVTYPVILFALKPFSPREYELLNNIRLSLQQKVGLGSKS